MAYNVVWKNVGPKVMAVLTDTDLFSFFYVAEVLYAVRSQKGKVHLTSLHNGL